MPDAVRKRSKNEEANQRDSRWFMSSCRSSDARIADTQDLKENRENGIDRGSGEAMYVSHPLKTPGGGKI